MLPKVTILRTATGPTGTKGDLKAPMFECRTLERCREGDHPCIPAGTYTVRWLNHPTHGWCYEVTGVKGRTAILFHSASWFDQLLGCIALGRAHGVVTDGKHPPMEGLLSSKDAIAGFVEAMGKKDFELTISWSKEVA